MCAFLGSSLFLVTAIYVTQSLSAFATQWIDAGVWPRHATGHHAKVVGPQCGPRMQLCTALSDVPDPVVTAAAQVQPAAGLARGKGIACTRDSIIDPSLPAVCMGSFQV